MFPSLKVLISLAIVATLTFVLVTADAEDNLVHCKDKHIVMNTKFGEIQKNCSSILPDGYKDSCRVLCLMRTLEAVDDEKRPNKEKFDKLVDEMFHADLRPKVKALNCFQNVSNIIVSDDMTKVCDSAKDFTGCFDNICTHLCE